MSIHRPRNTGNEAWAPFVAGAVARSDERHRHLRYRAGYYTFIVTTAATHLLFAAALIADAAGFTISLRHVAAIAGSLAVGSMLLYLALSWPVWRESMQTVRMRFDGNPKARRYALIWMLSSGLFTTGMFFICNHLIGELPAMRALGHSILQALVPVGISGFISLKRASKRDREEWSR